MTPREELFQIGHDAIKALSNVEVEATAEALEELGLYKLPYPTVSICVPVYDFVRVTGENNKPITGEWSGHLFAEGKLVGRVGEEPDPFFVQDNWLLAKSLSLETIDQVKIFWIWGDGKATELTPEAFSKTTMDKLDGNFPAVEARGNLGGLNEHERFCHISHGALARALIVLLATRNAVKQRTCNKLAKLGIGGKRNILHSYTYTTHISVPRPEDMDSDPTNPPTGVKRCPHLRRGHIRRQHHGPRNSMVKQVFIEPCFVNADPEFVSKRSAYNLSGQGPSPEAQPEAQPPEAQVAERNQQP